MNDMCPSFYTTLLKRIYSDPIAGEVESCLINLVNQYRGRISNPADDSLSEKDAILITYGDQVLQEGQPPLKSLEEFCAAHLQGVLNGIHILPFYPWSSDDGFSVKNFREVNPSLGTWENIERISQSFRLMVDLVINHASSQGEWFQAFLRDETPYRSYFVNVEGGADLSEVVRPRALPLLTEFQTKRGQRQVWTTFSPDQVDLNFKNPDVLLEFLDILLLYVEKGAMFIRLDAIAYLWKEIGTTCIHLPQTHAIIQLLRAVLDQTAPHVRLVTETNVPHKDNVSYFGDGNNEAQMVYNFALPPLVLHTLRTGDASSLSKWAAGLGLPSRQTTFFNFLASHDGIGLNPARGILTQEEIDALIDQVISHGGLISYKQNSDGTQTPYEMNISYFDALSDPDGDEPIGLQVDRFMAAQAMMLCLRGIPGIYFHSLFGSRNWLEGVELKGQNRAINRQKLNRRDLEGALNDGDSLRAKVFRRYRQLLLQRSLSPAFHPHGRQKILDLGKHIFAVLRTSPNGRHKALCLQNVSPNRVTAGEYPLEPYQTLWVDNP